jgi:hypothetical protein
MLDFGQRGIVPMAEETTFSLLQRRRQELSAQISALKGQIGSKEAELAQVEKALTVIEPPPPAVANLPQKNSNAVVGGDTYAETLRSLFKFDETIKEAAAQIKTAAYINPETVKALKSAFAISDQFEASFLNQLKHLSVPDPKFARMTIKELVIQALIDHFPNGGTLTQIRDFIRDGYGRVIEPSRVDSNVGRNAILLG